MLISYFQGPKDVSLQEIESPKKDSWVRIVTHDRQKVEDYAKELKLDVDSMLDGVDLYEAPRIEHAGGSTYIYVRYCEPSGDLTSTEPLLLVISPDKFITLSRKKSDVLDTLLSTSKLPTAERTKHILHILSIINRGYRAYINSVTKQIFTSKSRLKRRIISNDDVLGFIDTEEDLNEFLAALMPYSFLLEAMQNGKYMKLKEEDKEQLDDVILSTNEIIELCKGRLKTIQNIREAYNTIATNNLNRIFKRLTSITIFLMIPTIISGVYGMNVALPGMNNPNVFWIIAFLASVLVASSVITFKKKGWI